jgi:hypothetical protein
MVGHPPRLREEGGGFRVVRVFRDENDENQFVFKGISKKPLHLFICLMVKKAI